MYLPDSAQFGAVGREQFSSVVASISVTHYFAISMRNLESRENKNGGRTGEGDFIFKNCVKMSVKTVKSLITTMALYLRAIIIIFAV